VVLALWLVVRTRPIVHDYCLLCDVHGDAGREVRWLRGMLRYPRPGAERSLENTLSRRSE
jgi:hypothetical protein